MTHLFTMRIGLAVVFAVVVAGCGGSGVSRPNPDSLASEIGAAWCQDTGYLFQNRLDGSKAEVYDCNMPDGSYKCVEEQGGLARDVTVEFKLLLASTITREQDKPTCALGG